MVETVSYEIYIVHYMFVIGVVSLNNIIKNNVIKSILFIIFTIVSSLILKIITDFVLNIWGYSK